MRPRRASAMELWRAIINFFGWLFFAKASVITGALLISLYLYSEKNKSDSWLIGITIVVSTATSIVMWLLNSDRENVINIDMVNGIESTDVKRTVKDVIKIATSYEEVYKIIMTDEVDKSRFENLKINGKLMLAKIKVVSKATIPLANVKICVKDSPSSSVALETLETKKLYYFFYYGTTDSVIDISGWNKSLNKKFGYRHKIGTKRAKTYNYYPWSRSKPKLMDNTYIIVEEEI